MTRELKKRFENEGFGKEARILCLDRQPYLGHAIATLEQVSGSETDSNRHRTRWAANYVDNFLVSQVTSRLSTYHVMNLVRYLTKSGIRLPKTWQELKEFRKGYEQAGFNFREILRRECQTTKGGYLRILPDKRR